MRCGNNEESYGNGCMYEYVWDRTRVVSLDIVGCRVRVGGQAESIPWNANYLMDKGVNIYDKLDGVIEFSIDNLIDRIREGRHDMEKLVSFSGVLIQRDYRIDDSSNLAPDLFDRHKVY